MTEEGSMTYGKKNKKTKQNNQKKKKYHLKSQMSRCLNSWFQKKY